MPRVGSAAFKLDPALVLGTHLSIQIRMFSIPEACRMQHIDQPQGLVPLLWNAEGLGVDVCGLQGRPFIEQVATDIPEALCELSQKNTPCVRLAWRNAGLYP